MELNEAQRVLADANSEDYFTSIDATEHTDWYEVASTLNFYLQQAQEERDALVRLLKEYGDHHWTCKSTHGDGQPCDCIYGATLEKYEATRKEVSDGPRIQ